MIKAIVYIFLLFPIFLIADDYSFDFDEFEKKPYDFMGNCNIEIGSDIQLLNNSSNLYSLYFYNKDTEKEFFNHFISLRLNGSYQISDFKFYSDISDKVILNKEDEFENEFKIYESNLNIELPKKISVKIGKTAVKWGKGYVYNPVSFIGREKDLNDVDATLEGYWMFKLDYVKSFSGFIKNFSITTTLLPVFDEINEDFSENSSNNFFLNTYFFVNNTDIDFYLQVNDNNKQKYGAAFAHNIIENWEIHGEYSQKNSSINTLDKDFQIQENNITENNYIFGSRILFSTNTTLILEYLHNDKGFTQDNMDNFYNAVHTALTKKPDLIKKVKIYQSENLNNQYLMQDYLYVKISHPEPLDILYFTPSMFTLYNLVDNSFMLGLELIYSRFENFNFKLRYNTMFGESFSEFGEKIGSDKIFLNLEYVF